MKNIYKYGVCNSIQISIAIILFFILASVTGVNGQSLITNGRIAFVQRTDNGDAIFTINSDGSNLSQLTNTNSFDPIWSPNGTEVAFVSLQDGYKNRLSIIDSDGSNYRIIEPSISASSPDWSPNGATLAFSSPNDVGGQDIYTIEADGSNLTLITSANSQFYGHPTWISNNELLVLGDMSDDISADLGPTYTLYRVNLILNTFEELHFIGSSVSNLDISPNGNDIIYDFGLGSFSVVEIYNINTDTVTRLFEYYNGSGIYASNASWSATGNEIVYLHQSVGEPLQLSIYNLNSQVNTPINSVHPLENGVSWQQHVEVTSTPTPTSLPASGDFTVTSRIDGQDDNQQSIFAYTLTNTSSTPQSNLYMRFFFTVDNGRTADDYVLQSYYDSSNALTISGPFQWDATNHYFILSYGSSTLAPNASYQFQGVLRLADFSNNYSASNDWWHTGILSFQDSQTDYLPVYANGVLNTGSVPSGAPQPTNTPAPTTTVTAPTSTPSGAAVIQVESRIDGNDDAQQAGFRYRLNNTSTQAQGNLSTRIYFTLDGSQVASDYVLEKYFDQSGVATISGPILANGNTYYFQVTYGATSLQPNSAWEFQGALHLVNYASNFSSSNDWWHTGIGSAYQDTSYIPTYINGVIEVGQEP